MKYNNYLPWIEKYRPSKINQIIGQDNIIRSIKNKFKIPVFAYQVSGEYSMLSNAVEKKIINKDAIFENLMSFKRAGANAIVSYYADRLNEILP